MSLPEPPALPARGYAKPVRRAGYSRHARHAADSASNSGTAQNTARRFVNAHPRLVVAALVVVAFLDANVITAAYGSH